MNNEKNKLIILGVLALVFVGGGVFTFLPSAQPAPTPTPPPNADNIADTSAATGADATNSSNPDAASNGTTSENADANTTTAEGTITIHADGTTTSTGDIDAKLAEAFGSNGGNGQALPGQNLLALAQLPARDPFEPPTGAVKAPNLPPAPTPEPPVERPAPRLPAPAARRDPGFAPMPVPGIGGQFPSGAPGQANLPPVEVTPRFRVKGVLIGNRSIAVFEDSNGNQRLVPVGGSVDGDTQVTNIEQGRVTVRHRGKTQVLTIEEEVSND